MVEILDRRKKKEEWILTEDNDQVTRSPEATVEIKINFLNNVRFEAYHLLRAVFGEKSDPQ